MKFIAILLALLSAVLVSCKRENTTDKVITPWGAVQEDSVPLTEDFTLTDIVANGEMIMLTLSGPETYYDYRGRGMGAQFLLCEKFAQHLGVSLRVELCGDTTEMVRRLRDGEGDVIAFLLPKRLARADSLLSCGVGVDSLGVQWAVDSGNTELAEQLNQWYKPNMLADIKREEKYLLSTASVKRHVYSPFLNRSTGVISKYDTLFRKYAATARWDWRLMAAQCYQESCFDPNARSWAGARGLMQIMPGTAAHLGLSMEDIHSPEANIAAAARYIRELTEHFHDIPDGRERQYFVLAAYNGGSYHVRDAMALTSKYGGNPRRWSDVSTQLARLSDPQYYRDPVVKHGYMRSSETLDYVEKIRLRYAQYRGAPASKLSPSEGKSYSPLTPRKAKRKYKYHV